MNSSIIFLLFLVKTANVVLDGVQTQVNLGNNLTFGFGSDSDDSD